MNNFFSGMFEFLDRIDDSHLILVFTALTVICPGLLMLVVFFPEMILQLDVLKLILLTAAYGMLSLLITVIVLLGVLQPEPSQGRRSRYFWWVFAVFAMAGGVVDSLFIVIIFLLHDVFGVEKIGFTEMGFHYYIGFHIVIFAVVLPLWVSLTRKSLNKQFSFENLSKRNQDRSKKVLK